MKETKKLDLGQRLQLLRKGAVVKSTGQNEAIDAEGGVLVQHVVTPDIFSANFAEGSLYAKCKIFNVGENANGLKITVALEPTRNTSGIKGGIVTYWVGEGVTKTASTAGFGQVDLQPPA